MLKNDLITRADIEKMGYVNYDRRMLDLLGIYPAVGVENQRVWIAYKSNGDFLIYTDCGNEWCSILLRTDKEE